MAKLSLCLAAALAVAVVGTASAETLRVGLEGTVARFISKMAEGNLTAKAAEVPRGAAGLMGPVSELVAQNGTG